MKRKVLGILMSIVLICTVFSNYVFAVNNVEITNTKVSWFDFTKDEGFSDGQAILVDTAGSKPGNTWYAHATSGATGAIMMSGLPSGSTGALAIEKKASGSEYVYYRGSEITKGIAVYKTRIYIVNDSTHKGNSFLVRIHAGNTQAFKVTLVANADRTKSTVDDKAIGGNGFTYNEWMNVQIVINLDTKTYTSYVNGTQAGTANTAYSSAAVTLKNICLNFASTVTDGLAYVDYSGFETYADQDVASVAANAVTFDTTVIPNTQTTISLPNTINLNDLFNADVTWQADSSVVDTASGTVIPNEEDTVVTLTPTASYGSATVTGTPVRITVKGLSKLDAVTREINAISFDEIKNQNTNINNVDSDLNLWDGRNTVLGYADVAWSSSNNDIISANTGEVNCSNVNTQVTLTAKFTFQDYPDITVTRDFVVTVLADTDDASAVAAAASSLTLGDISAIKGDMVLPITGRKSTTITWKSSNPSVISETGKVSRMSDSDQKVTLTATISRNDAKTTKDFVVTVKGFVALTVDSIWYKDLDGNSVFAPTDGGKIDKLTLTSYVDNSTLKGTESLIVVVYNSNGQLDGCKVYSIADFNLPFEQSKVIENLNIPVNSGEKIKIFTFNSISDIRPVASVFESPNTVNSGTKIYVAGDSTASVYDDTRFPQTGWAQVLQNYFNTSDVTVVDKAASGRSSKSFIDEGKLKEISNLIKAGDYFIIQFGHNDDDPAMYTNPSGGIDDEGSFKNSLMNYIKVAEDKGAYPILATSISRRNLSDAGLEAYVNATRELGAELNIPVIDLYSKTKTWINSVGLGNAKDMFNYVKPYDSRFMSNSKFSKSSQYLTTGQSDNTHLNYYGADLISSFAAEEMKRLKLPLSGKINSYTPVYPLPPYADATSTQ